MISIIQNVDKTNKKSFTLIEIIIVTIIISLVYYFSISSFSFSKIISNKTNIQNIQTFMSKYSFDNSLSLKCINDGKKCLVFRDGNVTDEILNLFLEKPIVYEYNKSLKIVEFSDIELEHLQRYEVCFEYNINKYRKKKDIIVQVKDKVYILNSFTNKVIILEYLNDVIDYFDNLEYKVRNDF